MEKVIVDESADSKRLDITLARHPKISSRSEAKRIIAEGDVKINNSDKKISASRAVKSGDVITFNLIPKPSYDFTPIPFDLDIVYEDDYLIVVNKPAGMVVHPAPGHYKDTLVNYLLYHTRLSSNNSERPGIVHRIDKDTSGLLVVAKDNATHEHLAKQFFDHSIKRIYHAIVWGTPDLPYGRIDQPLGRDPRNRKKFTVRPDGKNAITNWKILESYRYLSLIECRLKTGRTHQIRVHLSSIGHPLLGDDLYGNYRDFGQKLPNHVKTALRNFKGQALHAKTLGFEHPKTNQRIFLDSELPEKIRLICEMIR